jgi:hypothetical protein
LFVGRVSPNGFELLSSNEMDEQIIAMPVPIRGKVLIRGAEHLFCVGPATANESQKGG